MSLSEPNRRISSISTSIGSIVNSNDSRTLEKELLAQSRLFSISINTIKAHANNNYGTLRAIGRVPAAERAKQLDLQQKPLNSKKGLDNAD